MLHIFLTYIWPPLVGALIGYITNYIAVKMLFFPKHEVRIFGHRLPFTPGAIPKGQKRFAKKAGDLIAGTLLTKEDITRHLTQPEFETHLVNRFMEILQKKVGTLAERIVQSPENLEKSREKIIDAVSESILKSVKEADVKQIVAEKGTEMIRKKLDGSLMGAFISDHTIEGLTAGVGEEIENYINQNGKAVISKAIDDKLAGVEDSSAAALLAKMDFDAEKLRVSFLHYYHELIADGVDRILKRVNISAIVEEKIDAMTVEELEDMVFSVMKKEFSTIVNLGALIGFVLGLLNLII